MTDQTTARWDCNTCPFTTTDEDAARGHEFAAPPRGWLGDGRAHSLSLIVEKLPTTLGPGLVRIFAGISEEAASTRGTRWTYDEAVTLLIADRIERGILSNDEAQTIADWRASCNPVLEGHEYLTTPMMGPSGITPAGSTIATDEGVVIAEQRHVEADWWLAVYQGRVIAVREKAGRFGRTGVAIRGWYDDGDRLVRVVINTGNTADKYEVMDFAGNWEEIR